MNILICILKMIHYFYLMFLKILEKCVKNLSFNTNKANNKYMKDYDKNKEQSYLKYWDVNNLYGWKTSLKLPVNSFEWIGDTSQFNEDFIKSQNEESDEGYLLEVDVQYLKKLPELHNDLSFLKERMKIGKVERLVTNLHDNTQYVIHIRN